MVRSSFQRCLVMAMFLSCAGARGCPFDSSGEEGGDAPLFPDEMTTTITIKNHGVEYTRTVGVNATYAWDAAKLGEVANLSTIDMTSTSIWIHGQRPRELFVFNNSIGEDLAPGAPPSWWPIPLTASMIKVATVGTTESRSVVNRTVGMGVMSARLIDHGGCFTPTALTPTTLSVPGTPTVAEPAFKLIADKITASLKKCDDVTEESIAFQPSFLIPPGTPDLDVTLNDDGFSFRADYTGCVKFLGIRFCDVFQLGATYAVRNRDGFLAFELIGEPELFNVPSGARSAAAHTLGKGTTGGCMPAGGNECDSSPDFGKPCLHDWQCDTGKCLGVPLTEQLREALLDAITRKDVATGGTGTEIAPTTCDMTTEKGDQECEAAGPGFVRLAYKDKTGDSAGADWIEANIKPKSFICRPSTSDPSAGKCFYRPFFQRFNVLPDRLEAVWFNSNDVAGVDPNTADFKFVQAIDPTSVPVFCGADYMFKGPTGIPFFAR